MNVIVKRRGSIAAVVSVITTAVCLSVSLWSKAGVIPNAIVILITAVAGFHVVAWFTHARKRSWQILDYALELITVTSIFAALAGVQQSAVTGILQAEFAKRKAEQSSLIYYIKGVITNDCYPKESRKNMWTPSLPPYEGACDRIEHFLPQIEYIFGKETGIESMTSDDSWARNILVNEEGAVGSWDGLYSEARRFIEGSRRTRVVLESYRPLSTGFIATLASSGKIQYWHYLLAFVLGLRLARRSAGIFAERHKHEQKKDPEPNKAPEPTSGTGTPPAEPGVAPVPPAAHL